MNEVIISGTVELEPLDFSKFSSETEISDIHLPLFEYVDGTFYFNIDSFYYLFFTTLIGFYILQTIIKIIKYSFLSGYLLFNPKSRLGKK